FRANFASDQTISFPEPYYPFVSDCVLVEEHIEGTPISEFLGKGARSSIK
ncbi:hypothetical protein SARC_15283, partial [Sphaeroforma arctica JP610]